MKNDKTNLIIWAVVALVIGVLIGIFLIGPMTTTGNAKKAISNNLVSNYVVSGSELDSYIANSKMFVENCSKLNLSSESATMLNSFSEFLNNKISKEGIVFSTETEFALANSNIKSTSLLCEFANKYGLELDESVTNPPVDGEIRKDFTKCCNSNNLAGFGCCLIALPQSIWWEIKEAFKK